MKNLVQWRLRNREVISNPLDVEWNSARLPNNLKRTYPAEAAALVEKLNREGLPAHGGVGAPRFLFEFRVKP